MCFFSIAWSWSHLFSSLSHSAAFRRYYIKNDYSCDCGVCLQARNSRRRAAKEIEIYMSWSIIPMQRDILYILLNFFFLLSSRRFFPFTEATFFDKEPTVQIQCLSGHMVVTVSSAPVGNDGLFSGMIYPKGLSSNSTCLSEYRSHKGTIKYKLPLRSCNTMPKENVSFFLFLSTSCRTCSLACIFSLKFQ